MALTPRLYAPSERVAVLRRAMVFLIQHECLNNMIIGNLENERPLAFILTLEDPDQRVHWISIQTPARPALISTADLSLLPLILSAIDRAPRNLPGVVGPEPFSLQVARHLSPSPKLFLPLGVYSCTAVQDPESMPLGSSTTAMDVHTSLLIQWLQEFLQECGEPCTLADAQARVLTDQPTGCFKVWLLPDGTPVSVAASAGRTPNGIRINFVYTPPMHRKCGYAAANVARYTRVLLEEGRKFVFLFTDMNNTMSNALYQRIGFSLQGRSAHYHL